MNINTAVMDSLIAGLLLALILMSIKYLAALKRDLGTLTTTQAANTIILQEFSKKLDSNETAHAELRRIADEHTRSHVRWQDITEIKEDLKELRYLREQDSNRPPERRRK